MASIDREPLAANSVRNLALALTKNSEAEKGQGLMRSAAKLSRRDLPTHFWLIQDYGRANDLPKVLMHVDQALRTKEAAWQQLIPALHAGLANSELVKPTVQLLRTDPPWKEQFWMRIEQFPKSLGNIGDVLIGLQAAGTDVDPSVPESIINQLGYTGQYAKAYDIYRKVYGTRRLPKSPEYVSNANFSAATSGTVFDWTTSQKRIAGSVSRPRAGRAIGQCVWQYRRRCGEPDRVVCRLVIIVRIRHRSMEPAVRLTHCRSR